MLAGCVDGIVVIATGSRRGCVAAYGDILIFPDMSRVVYCRWRRICAIKEDIECGRYCACSTYASWAQLNIKAIYIVIILIAVLPLPI